MKVFAALLFLSLTACGFTPVYAPQNGSPMVQESMSSISVETIPDRPGQIVRNHLLDRLYYQNGYPVSPRYRLVVSPIAEEVVEIGIDRDDEASRAQLRQRATFNLIDTNTGKPVLKRTVRAVSSYNILSGQFTTFITQQDARKQSLRALADNIMTELELYFAR